MMRIFVLVIALWLHAAQSRRLSDSISNDIASNNDISYGRRKDWVMITSPPTPVVTRLVGSRTELECEATGSPVPTIQWLKGNTPITENESYETNVLSDLPTRGIAKVISRLVISASLPIHDDTYTCIAECGSKVATAKSRLYVDRGGAPDRNFTQLLADQLLGGAQPPRIVLYSPMFMDVIGQDLILPCKSVGNPHPSIIWLNNAEQVIGNSDPRFTVHQTGELRIRNLHWSDMGPYTCVARNSQAQDTATTFVYPMTDK